MFPIRWINHPHSVLIIHHTKGYGIISFKNPSQHITNGSHRSSISLEIRFYPWMTQQLSLIHLKHTDMKLFLRILTTSFSIAFTVALFLSILIIAEMKSWTFLWLYVPLFLVVYEMEKINLKKKKHTSSFKYRKYTSLYD